MPGLEGRAFILRFAGLHNLKPHAEGALLLIPVRTKHLETPDLRGTADMTANTGADIIITNADQTDGVGDIFRQTVGKDFWRKIIPRDELEGHRQVLVNHLIHPKFNLLLFLTRRLVVKIKTHLALLPLYMRIIRPLAAKQPDHCLVQQMLRSMRRRELFLVVLVKNGIHILML